MVRVSLDLSAIISNLGLGGFVVYLSFKLLTNVFIKLLLPYLIDINHNTEETKEIVKELKNKLT